MFLKMVRKAFIILYVKWKTRFLRIPYKRIWNNAFIRYFLDDQYGYEEEKNKIKENKKNLLRGFVCKDINLVKKSRGKYKGNIPIVISVVKNEMDILPTFFSHYRKMGITKFVMIDNMSSDGTLEYLKKQKDADIYQVDQKCIGFVKEGWINRILALYGFNRWYLFADADELLVWPQMEETGLKEMLSGFKKAHCYRPLAIMLDMYSKGFLYQSHVKDIFREFCYCDYKTYYWTDNPKVDILSGGCRERTFKCKEWLSKTPLFYFRPAELFCCAHYLYPYQKSENAKCFFALLHYKFVYKHNYLKMKKYINDGTFNERTGLFMKYIKNKRFSFYYEDSLYLDDMKKLYKIPCMDDEAEEIE